MDIKKEDLGVLDRIILQTGQINYLSSRLNSLLMGLTVRNEKVQLGFREESIIRNGQHLESVDKSLNEIMNHLGDVLNNMDALEDVDTEITNPVFNLMNQD